MTKELIPTDEKAIRPRKPDSDAKPVKQQPGDVGEATSALTSLQQQVGNRAVQRLLVQRSGDEPTELDDETADRITRERGSGQPLDSAVQANMSDATGHDFGGVKVHTSPEADDLNRQLGAKAFTTGQDVFFSEGAYEPHTTSGQELVAHELTHVVQQSSGAVSGGGRMTVNAPGDVYEQEADAIARTITGGEAAADASAGAEVQRQIEEEEEEPIQMQALEEEEEEEIP